MTTPAGYCIDTNSILERNRNYPPDIFVTLWQGIEQLIAAGRLVASDEVKQELGRVHDEAGTWARSQSGLFVPMDKAQTDEVTRILEDFEDLLDYRKGKSGADPFVIALARVRGYAVVTYERKAPPKTRPTIPNVCEHYKIPCFDLRDLSRAEGWTF